MASFCKKFLSTFLRRQLFDLPDSMMYYILKNPKSSKVYQKLIQSCKYFFIKNPILVFHCFEITDNGWKTCSNQMDCTKKFLHSVDSKILSNCRLWIVCKIRIHTTDSTVASNLIPKIYQCDATHVFFKNQNMFLQQFLFFAQNVEASMLQNVILSSDLGAEILLEELIANLPNIFGIAIKYGPNSRAVSSDTATKLLQLPHFKNITKLHVLDISEEFDIDPIYAHYKKNRTRFTFALIYKNQVSEGFAQKLDGIAFEILDYKFHDNETPYIGYPQQNILDRKALLKLYKKSLLFSR